jgi:thiol:disulfide interchange protein
MKSSRMLIGVACMFLALAVGLSVVIWQDTSLAAIVGLFALGFGCGMATGVWSARRSGESGG